MAAKNRPRLNAEPRTSIRRKSALRRLRAHGEVPASLFGHGDPQSIQVKSRELTDYLRHHTPGALLDLVVAGNVFPALIREIDRHPLNGHIITLGLQRVNLSETLKAVIPITFEGEDELIKNDLVLEVQMDEIEVHGRADLLPESIGVDVSKAKSGDAIRISDLKLPAGIEVTRDPELPVAMISSPTVPADVEAALEAEEAAHAEERAANEAEEVEAKKAEKE